MQIFYTRHISDDTILLEDQEAIHCHKVLRKKIGDSIHIIDGKGSTYIGHITQISKKSVEAQIVSSSYVPPNEKLPSIAFAILKNSTRLEWLLEKVTEIGVASFQPLITQRCERRNIKTERLEKIILSALKQSKQPYLPVLHNPVSYQKYIDLASREGAQDSPQYIAHYQEGQPHLWEHPIGEKGAHFLIGPEGDFTETEVQMALDAGWTSVNLGTSRLRAETACMVACAHLNAYI